MLLPPAPPNFEITYVPITELLDSVDLLLAVAALTGYLFQRHVGLPKVVGYSLVGTVAGLAGFSGAVWPLQGIGLFLLELGMAIVLATLSTLYALTLGSAHAELINRSSVTLVDRLSPVLVVLGVSILVAAVLALVLRSALRIMSPTSENTSMLLLALVAAATTVAAHMGGSAPLAALLAGMLIKQMHPRPWAWPRQLGSASSMLTMLMFVLVSTVAAQADWNAPVVGVVLALVLVRLLAKAVGVGLGNVGSGASWRQALWVGMAMTPMSAIALLIASQFAMASPSTGHLIAGVALPAILLMEVLGAILATVAIYRTGESSKPWWAALARNRQGGDSNGA